MLNNWLFWAVPEHKTIHYAFTMLIMMFVIPVFVFGIRFTILGNLINFLIYDALYYFFYQVERAMRGDRDE